MAIKMDGHTITSLQLKASDGSEVTKQLTEEGTIPTPTGSLSITANGNDIDVTEYAAVDVNVPQGITPSGTLEITANGTYDITNYASVVVNVTSAKTLESITAVYTQGATVVYPSTALEDLKDNLVVTAVYSDDSTEAVVDYTLSGVLAEGTSTITVAYQEKTATFTVTVSSEEYTDLNYIQATGTQYIDTGIYFDNLTEVEIEYGDWTADGTDGKSNAMFGTYEDIEAAGGGNGSSYELRAGSAGAAQAPFGNSNNAGFNIPTNDRHTLKMGGLKVLVDGNEKKTLDDYSFTSSLTALIFAQHNIVEPYASRFGKYKLYSFKVTKNNTIIANFSPKLDGNGVPCLYDSIGQRAYYNAGTGDFQHG